ncbi:MAG TPA: endonuclease Q family protein [Patescibacteria group bacterium]|nr:endonuclease Q family protein [Patescibacteria group bacterium]
MQVIADLQLHSKYSRAVSPQMILPQICAWTKRKGMGLVATGDWTHPLWMKEIKDNLEELGNGLLRLKPAVEERELKIEKVNPTSPLNSLPSPLFLLATEVSCIYSQGGKGRRVHTLIWVPTLAATDKINKEMTRQGCNLMSDGRPIIGLTSIQVAELVLTIEPHALIIPAHAWTPWFSVFGSMSGFNSIEEAYGPFAKHIYAVETGLSSNPSMNWRIKELDNRSIVSFSDAHSGPKLGRESTVFNIPDGKLSYDSIYDAIKQPFGGAQVVSSNSRVLRSPASAGAPAAKNSNLPKLPAPFISYTIEFYPEEGKYHWTGHRACNIRWGPKQTAKNGTTCPVCGKPLTQGVEQRVSELAGRSEEDLKLTIESEAIYQGGALVNVTKSKAFPNRAPFVMLVPLQEIIAECIGSPVASPKVQTPYLQLTDALGGEFSVLLKSSHKEIEHIAGERVAVGVEKVRRGDIVIDPGYDGVFGVVKLWREGEEKPLIDSSREQLRIL